jgi:hypothetical protein
MRMSMNRNKLDFDKDSKVRVAADEEERPYLDNTT